MSLGTLPQGVEPASHLKGIVTLAEVTRADKKSVGNKASLLGELSAAGLPVTPGLVLCTATCSGLRAARSLSTAQLNELEEKIEALWPDCSSFAVRTSTVEGERSTEQNLRDTRCEYFVPKDALAIAIIAAASVTGERNVDRAVMIQPMVDARVSGVVFAGALHAGSSGNFFIEACWGLGRALVEGHTDPDRYQLDRNTAVIEKERGRKQHQIEGNGSGVLVSVSEEQRLAWTLNPEQLAEVTQLAKRCATVLGAAQDIEFAVTDDSVTLLQSRPVASARLAPENVPPGKWVVNLAQLEHASAPFTPLTEDLWADLLPDFARFIHGRIYLDVEKLNARMPLATSNEELAKLLLNNSSREYPAISLIKLLRALPRWLVNAPWAGVFWRRSRKLSQKKLEDFGSYANHCAADQTADAQALLRRLVRGKSIFTTPWRVPFVLNASCARHHVYGALLDRALKRWAKRELAPSTVAQLYACAPEAFSNRMAGQVAELGRQVSRSPELASLFVHQSEETEQQAPLSSLSLHTAVDLNSAGSTEFLEDFSAFIKRFGHRGARDLELSSASWIEEPSLLLAMIGIGARVNLATNKAPPGPDDGYRLQLLARDDLHQALSKRWQRRIVDHLLNRICDCLRLRDDSLHFAAHAVHLVRSQLLQIEDRLMRDKKLQMAGDIFFLSWNDIRYLERGQLSPDDANTLIAAAKDQHAERSSGSLKWALGFKPDFQPCEPPPGDPQPDTDTDVVQGRGAAPGTGIGPARIALGPADIADFLPGEVLVLLSAEPALAPAVQMASAVVCERGGRTSYLSALARLWGIPCVVGAYNCTRAIAGGELLEINGVSGTVKVVSSADSEGSDA